MSALAVLILALSMSADAFAAALARGAAMRPGWLAALRGGAIFGLVEATTPLAGWLLGRLAQELVARWSHWIAFVLLLLVGLHMLRNGLRKDGDEGGDAAPAGLLLLTLTAISTSIDSAAVGVGLAMLDVNIVVVAGAIGLSTFVCTTIGLQLGARAGQWLGPRAELLAGLALIGLAFAILFDAGTLIAGQG